jgi:protein SCO1/2
MKKTSCIVTPLILLALVALFAATAGPALSAQPDAKGQTKTVVSPADGKAEARTERGLYEVSISVAGAAFAVGPNSVNLMIRDKGGKPVSGADVAVVPWLPSSGHGVWEKPVTLERGGGIYRVDNVVLVRSGQWDLRVTVKSGAGEDRAIFSVSVGPGARTSREEPQKSKRRYVRSVEAYTVPNVTLINQDGKKVNFASFIDSGKPVVVDFIYTTCTTICPVLSAGFAGIRNRLGKDADAVQLVSVSIDPENDRPEQMKHYLSMFKAGPGWDFLTGSREDIGLVLKALDAEVPDKMAHKPLYLIRGSKSDQWVRIYGLVSGADLMEELRRVENKGVNEPLMTH